MTRLIATLMTFTALILLNSSDAQAQHLFRRGAARQGVASVTSAPVSTASASATTPSAARVYSYSYYMRSNLPARTYVGYGDNDFPFHGAPYGHPYDPWTWPAMSGSYQAGLARYYSPPLK